MYAINSVNCVGVFCRTLTKGYLGLELARVSRPDMKHKGWLYTIQNSGNLIPPGQHSMSQLWSLNIDNNVCVYVGTLIKLIHDSECTVSSGWLLCLDAMLEIKGLRTFWIIPKIFGILFSFSDSTKTWSAS